MLKSLVVCSLFALVVVGCSTPQKVAERAVDYGKCRALQGEAQTALRAIHAAQANQKAARDTYANTIGDLGIDVEEQLPHYSIKLVTVTETRFVAEAKGTHDANKGDTWRVNEKGDIDNTRDGCKQ